MSKKQTVMAYNDDLPFYLRADGPKILSQSDIDHFVKDNPKFKKLVKKYTFDSKILKLDLFTGFCHWIIGQQLSVKAAESILNRFRILVSPITPENVLSQSHDVLRGCGLSNSKANYLKNIANFVIAEKQNPILQNPENYTSDEIRTYLTQIKGVGPWTVNMHLIFGIGKKDVFAIGDLVVRKGIQKMYGLDELPTEQFCRKNYEWGQYATVGTFLAWNIIGD